jgi:hypothetical protein
LKTCGSKFWSFFLLAAFFLVAASNLSAQKTVDKMMATVSDGVRTDLITYSDLLWQMALEKDVPLNPPNARDLELTLENLINQRLLALESERLPTAPPTKEEVDREIRRVLAQFPTVSAFVERLRTVGFTSIEDINFVRLMERRVATEKYLDFRFRSFVVITPEDEETFYRDVFKPNFEKANPNLIVPPLDEKLRLVINRELTEEKIGEDIETFLADARERALIIYLKPVEDKK